MQTASEGAELEMFHPAKNALESGLMGWSNSIRQKSEAAFAARKIAPELKTEVSPFPTPPLACELGWRQVEFSKFQKTTTEAALVWLIPQ